MNQSVYIIRPTYGSNVTGSWQFLDNVIPLLPYFAYVVRSHPGTASDATR
jgi:hypothetical protein